MPGNVWLRPGDHIDALIALGFAMRKAAENRITGFDARSIALARRMGSLDGTKVL
jgi:hypothetical protein